MKWIVDRVAGPWLIKKFVDKDPEFVFEPPSKVMEEAERLGATPFDVNAKREELTIGRGGRRRA
jgi:hypothetical protein